MKVFFGAAIQGVRERGTRSSVYYALIECIKGEGHVICSEHSTGFNHVQIQQKLENAIGPLPKNDTERRTYVRNKMIEALEGDIYAAIFEVSVPSLGTGVELAHAYLRPRMNLPPVPILALYEKDYWPNELSTMIRGITKETVPNFTLKEYSDIPEATKLIREFLRTQQKK